MLILAGFRQWRGAAPAPPPPITEDTLRKTISDLTTINTSLPFFISLPSSPPLRVLIRITLILYAPYLALTYFVPLRIIIAIAGTVYLTWRARWASIVRCALWRSALLRHSAYRVWALMSGQPLSKTLSPQSQADLQALSVKSQDLLPSSASEIRFLFTVYENQRWWMGLDWTAALLPNERPSWCSASFQPVSPPMAFPLPASTTVYMPSSSSPTGRVKRTARWRWAEDEWRVTVRKEPGTASSRVVKPLPSVKEDSSSATRILRAVRRESTIGSGSSPERTRTEEHPEKGHASHGSASGGSASSAPSSCSANPSINGDEQEEEPLTDADGWVYGDNKWEYASGKGGMGKVGSISVNFGCCVSLTESMMQYTRYRRWTRVAVLSETIEPAEPGEMGIQRQFEPEGHSDLQPALPQVSSLESHEAQVTSDGRVRNDGHESNDASDSHDEGNGERSGLRQRLKAVVKSATYA